MNIQNYISISDCIFIGSKRYLAIVISQNDVNNPTIYSSNWWNFLTVVKKTFFKITLKTYPIYIKNLSVTDSKILYKNIIPKGNS